MPLSAGDKLGPYEILVPIGAGGMGAVYRARDPRLNRDVAIKVSSAQFSERFEREAEAIAALNHPHICQVYDVGPNYLVMEFIEGTPLKGPLTLDQALRHAVQICEALDAAHQKNITHRDLKPGNILVTAHGVKLLDFGLAKVVRAKRPEDATQTHPLTEAGAVMGTAAYMSPEQAKGEEVDARSDIFAFGAVLYEMLSGRRAFARNSSIETLSAVLRDEPPPLSEEHGNVSAIVVRCLRKSPADRFQTIREVRAALQQAGEQSVRTPAVRLPSIAILPFANMSRDADDEYFSDGLAEEIIGLLANIPGLKVIARTSAFAFKGKNEDIRKIADALGVSNVLEGSVRRAGNRLRITAQLIHAADGTHLWSQRYDRNMTDIFEIQDEISGAIAGQLKVHLTGRKRATSNVAAYEAYLEGRHHAQKFTPDAAAKARECYQRAIALDPDYALAHVGKAEYYLVQSSLGFTPPLEVIPQLEAAARRSLALDDTLADAHALLACARMFDYDWAEAAQLCRRALELSPTSISSTGAYATWYLRAQGLAEESLLPLERTLELDPLATLPRWSKGEGLFACRRYAEAEREFRRTLEIDPNHPGPGFSLGPALAMQQRFEEALAEAEAFVGKFGRRFPMALRTLAMVRAMTGQHEAARADLAELLELESHQYLPAMYIAGVYAALGEHDAAFAWTDKSIQQREPHLIQVIRFHPFELLRDDPRYAALLKRMNLA